MSVEILLSAMHLKDHGIIDELNIKGNAVVINQCDHDLAEEFDNVNGRVKFINVNERGLSKSRNLALKNASGDICIFCDNDVVYRNDYERILADTFEQNPEADIIVFFIRREERKSPVTKNLQKLSYINSMKIFSPEIAFRRKNLLEKGLFFDEDFGAGAKYSMGEENIFLFKAKDMGLNVLYAPVEIASLKENESTWFKGYNEKFFRDRGANYYAMSKRYCLLLIVQFAIRKYRLYCRQMNPAAAVMFMLQGVREYRQGLKK